MIFKPEAKPKADILDERQKKTVGLMIKQGTNLLLLRRRFGLSEAKMKKGLEESGFYYDNPHGKSMYCFVEISTDKRFQSIYS